MRPGRPRRIDGSTKIDARISGALARDLAEVQRRLNLGQSEAIRYCLGRGAEQVLARTRSDDPM